MRIPFPPRSSAALALGLIATACGGGSSPVQPIPGPKPVPTPAAFVLAYAQTQDPRAYTNLQAYHASLSAVSIASAYAMTPTGTLDTSGATATTASCLAFALANKLPAYAVIPDYNNASGQFDPAIATALDNDATLTATAVTSLVNFATSNGFAGINLDFEAVRPSDFTSFANFVTALASGLHAQGLKLIISLPPRNASGGDGYDWATLGAAVDYAQVMTYDEVGVGVGAGWSSDGDNGYTWPGPTSGLDWATAVLTYARTQIASSKLLSGLPAYGYDFSTAGTPGWTDFASILSAHPAAIVARDAQSATPYATWGPVTPQAGLWTDQTAQPALWYDDATSIAAKAALVGSLGLAGTGVWAMGDEDASYWQAVTTGLASTSSLVAYTLTATAGSNGAIIPSGVVKTVAGASQTFTFKPAAGYLLAGLTVDGAVVTPSASYAFTQVGADHALNATFAVNPASNPTALGEGFLWSGLATSASASNQVAAAGVNDGDLTTSIVVNGDGEGGAPNWEAAGVIWTNALAIASVTFINGDLDANGNGFFQANCGVQFSTDGATWTDSGWAVSPAYAYSSDAGGKTYTFTGTPRTGIKGVRVIGQLGDVSWSWSVKEVLVTTH